MLGLPNLGQQRRVIEIDAKVCLAVHRLGSGGFTEDSSVNDGQLGSNVGQGCMPVEAVSGHCKVAPGFVQLNLAFAPSSYGQLPKSKQPQAVTAGRNFAIGRQIGNDASGLGFEFAGFRV